MNRMWVAIGALVLTVGCVGAQEITMDGVARSVSLLAQFRTKCPAYFPLNEDYAHRMEQAFRMTGAKSYGEAVFGRALDGELPRRQREIAAAGARQWCLDEKAALTTLTNGELFKR